MSVAVTRAVDGNLCVWTYANLANENGEKISDGCRFPDKTIQATGVGTVTLEGSANGVNWEPLKDSNGVAISIDASTDACAVVLENPLHIRAVNNNATGALVVITGSR